MEKPWMQKFEIKPLWAVMEDENYYGNIYNNENQACKEALQNGFITKIGWGVFPLNGKYIVDNGKDIHFSYNDAIREAKLFYKEYCKDCCNESTIKKQVLYGLVYKKNNQMLGYETQSNEGDRDCCSSETYILSASEENEWLVESYSIAKHAKHNSAEWFNASYSTPMNCYKADDLIIVKVERVSVFTELAEEKSYKLVSLDYEKCVKKYTEGYYPAYRTDNINERSSSYLHLFACRINKFTVENAKNGFYKVIGSSNVRIYSPIYIKKEDCIDVV